MGTLSPFVTVMSYSLVILAYKWTRLWKWVMWSVSPELIIQTPWDKEPIVLNVLLLFMGKAYDDLVIYSIIVRSFHTGHCKNRRKKRDNKDSSLVTFIW